MPALLGMAGILWILFIVLCPFVRSESGDDDLSDTEVTCTSTLTLHQTTLTCSINDESSEEINFATLCSNSDNMCTNATLGQQGFNFENLTSLAIYELQVRGEVIEKDINLRHIVKIPAPEIKLATYMEDTEDVFIWFEHSHDYVRDPKFEVEIWGEKLVNKPINITFDFRNLSISRDRLGGDGIYYTRVRAKPVKYFDGNWSEWSSKGSFIVNANSSKFIIIIIFIIALVLVLIIGFAAVRVFWTRIRGNIAPNIPHPKATLAQMHKAKEGLPFTFSPEIFRDVFIHRVDYIDEIPSSPDLHDGLDESCYSQTNSSSSSLSKMSTMADECLPREQSHLKIRLLDHLDLSKEMENITSPQQECKDEAYVTMSSLFKTQ